MTGLPPRTVAAELGWVLPGGVPISWDVLLDLAVSNYWGARVAMPRSARSGDIVDGQQNGAQPPCLAGRGTGLLTAPLQKEGLTP